MRKSVLMAMFGLGVTGLSPAADAGASSACKTQTVVRDISHQKNAGAIFESYDPTGCILTDININASRDKTNSDGSLSNAVSVALTITSLNGCTGAIIIAADGLSTSQSVSIPGDLSTAHVTATVPMVDYNGIGFNAKVNLTWTPTDAVQVNNSRTTTHTSPGMKVVTIANGSYVDAEASGTIKVEASASHAAIPDATNGEPSYQATISNDKNGTVTTTITE